MSSKIVVVCKNHRFQAAVGLALFVLAAGVVIWQWAKLFTLIAMR